MRVAVIAVALAWSAMNAGAQADHADMVAKLKAGLTREFKDPGSAQYRNLILSGKSGVYSLCGEVNGKNSYGAYVGFRRFFISGTASPGGPFEAIPSMKHIEAPRNDYGMMEQVWPKFCADKIADVQ